MNTNSVFWRALLGTSIVFCFLTCGHALQAQKPIRNFLLRGIVKDADGQPVSGATVRTMTRQTGNDQSTTTSDTGAFAMKIAATGHYGESLLATSPDGSLSCYLSQYDYNTSERKPLQMVLHPWENCLVKVVDADERPVADATIVLQASYQELVREKTDASGACKLRFPSGADVDWINAFKDDVGYDYYENYDSFPTQHRLAVPKEVALKLTGAATATLKAVDSKGKPIANVNVSPWSIKLPGKISYANVGGTLFQETDQLGQTHFNWFPKDATPTTFLVYHEDYHCNQRPSFNPQDATEMSVTLLEKAIVTGKVTFSDGKPAARIRLQIEGSGADYFRGHTITDENGEYSLKVYPNQNLIIAVTEKRVAAAAESGVQLKPGAKHAADFELISGTIIHGTMTIGEDKRPLVGDNATLICRTGGGHLVRWCDCNRYGRYQFCVGPGKYQLTLPGGVLQIVEVKDEEELVFDGHLKRKDRDDLSGIVVNKDDRPLADVQVYGEPVGDLAKSGFVTRTNSEGKFQTERWTTKTLIYGVSKEQSLAGMVTINEDDRKCKLQLLDAAIVKTNVVFGDGSPVKNRPLVAMVHFKDQAVQVNVKGKTDEDGSFSLPVALGAQVRITVSDGRNFTHEGEPVQIERVGDVILQTITISKK